MATEAYVKLVPSAAKEEVTIDEVKQLFHLYKKIAQKTGEQVDWEYDDTAFPYEIKENEDGAGKWFYLSSTHNRYRMIVISIGTEIIRDEEDREVEQAYVKISLPNSSTFADKGKANEFAKFIAKELKGELHLFNDRIMYFYPRK